MTLDLSARDLKGPGSRENGKTRRQPPARDSVMKKEEGAEEEEKGDEEEGEEEGLGYDERDG